MKGEIAVLGIAALLLMRKPAHAASGNGTIIPLYSYPTSPSWSEVKRVKQLHPGVDVIAIANPDNGVGSLNSDYTSGINSMRATGVKVYGYVPTGYGSRTDVINHINSWYSAYPIDGIFLDEMANDSANSLLSYYQNITNHVHSKGGLTIGNPGTSTTPQYVQTVDVTMVYESAGLPSVSQVNYYGVDRSRLSVIPYEVQFDTNWLISILPYVKWVYVTNDTLGNPWDTLPPYYEQMVIALGSA